MSGFKLLSMRQFILSCFLLLGMLVQAQSPFFRVRETILNDNLLIAHQLVDSSIEKGYQKDSAIYYKGLIHLKTMEIKAARKSYATLIKNYPGFYQAHYLNALIYFLDNNFGRSIDEFNLVLAKNPNDTKALYNRSVAFGMLELNKEAINDLTACIAIEPINSLFYYSRAYWFEITLKYDEAIKDYEQCLELDTKNYDAYLGLAYIYENKKDPVKACAIISKAIAAGSQIAEDLKENFCK